MHTEMKRLEALCLCLMALCVVGCRAPGPVQVSRMPGATPAYYYHVDLRRLTDDQVTVTLSHIEVFNQRDTLRFVLPSIVPGIYGAMHFGKNVESFMAIDTQGMEIPVRRIDDNTWQIVGARDLSSITYRAGDGWDEFDTGIKQGFYRSAESSFTEGRVFVINHNSLLGYFTDYSGLPVEATYLKPSRLYAATALPVERREDRDILRAAHYRELVDHPVLFAWPDTALLHIGNTEVEIACYSNTGNAMSAAIAGYIQPLLENQRRYLGGQLPVDRYRFLIYHALGEEENGFIGDGLEHATSTLSLLHSAWDMETIRQFVYRIASHEFFHVLAPLAIHSEQIHDYDFTGPEMSRHLWLYEGMTEYATIHMPVKQGMVNIEKFLSSIEEKLRQMQGFDNDLPLTELSLQAMERQDQYYNVYLRGALAGLCLDLRLRELSAGRYGTQDMMMELYRRYGKDRYFKDDQLFDEIASFTFPEIRDFFRRHIESAEPLPIQAYLEKAGFLLNEKNLSVRPMKELQPEQLALRQAWLGTRE